MKKTLNIEGGKKGLSKHHYESALNAVKMKCDSPGRERHAGRRRHIRQINTQ